MKLAVFSDIHGNSDAFKVVKQAMLQERPDHYVFCGDLCGYYYNQNQVVIDMQSLSPLSVVLGNHDQDFLEMLKDDEKLEAGCQKYGTSYKHLKQSISDETMRFIKSMKQEILSEDGSWAAFHGSPWNPLEEYIYPDTEISRFKDLPYKFVFLGHTHYPMVRKIGEVTLVNPGSCGQPRDGGDPSFAVVDTNAGTAEIKRAPYSKEALKIQIHTCDPTKEYLVDVLDRKRPATHE